MEKVRGKHKMNPSNDKAKFLEDEIKLKKWISEKMWYYKKKKKKRKKKKEGKKE